MSSLTASPITASEQFVIEVPSAATVHAATGTQRVSVRKVVSYLLPDGKLVVNHRASYFAPALLAAADYIEFDNGALKPAHATPKYGNHKLPIGPQRKPTAAQAQAIATWESFPGGPNLHNRREGVGLIDAEGNLPLVDFYGHYRPRRNVLHADGTFVAGS